MNGLVLFDIDKTLLKKSSSRETIFSKAFKDVYGIDATPRIINTHGMTDQQIVVETLKKKGLTEPQIMSKINDCINAIINNFKGIEESLEVEVFDGIPELLKELDNRNFLIGLVTGNIESIARTKMKKANLNHYFKLGGFGNENIDRTELVKIAIKRAEENFGFKLNNNVFLIGDAPQDMNAGHKAGVISIGVTTGIYTEKELKDAGANEVVKNLEDTQKIIGMIVKHIP